MHAFVVLSLVFSIPSQKIGLGSWGKRLRNNLLCVEWDVKPQLNQSGKHMAEFILRPSFARTGTARVKEDSITRVVAK